MHSVNTPGFHLGHPRKADLLVRSAPGRELPITTPLGDRPLLSAKQPLTWCEFQLLEGQQAAAIGLLLDLRKEMDPK